MPLPGLAWPLCLKFRAGNREEIEVPRRSHIQPVQWSLGETGHIGELQMPSMPSFFARRRRISLGLLQTGFSWVVVMGRAQGGILAVFPMTVLGMCLHRLLCYLGFSAKDTESCVSERNHERTTRGRRCSFKLTGWFCKSKRNVRRIRYKGRGAKTWAKHK